MKTNDTWGMFSRDASPKKEEPKKKKKVDPELIRLALEIEQARRQAWRKRNGWT